MKKYIKEYPITFLFFMINLIFYILTCVKGTVNPAVMVDHFKNGPTNENIYYYGAFYKEAFSKGEYYRFLTSVFLHGNLMHIASNMIGLIAFSNAVEGFIGKFKYFIFYLLCGIGGNVATLFFGQSYTLSVGASGALWGMMGFFLFLAIFKRKYLSRGFSQTIFSLIALNAIVTFVVPNIDKTAHFGGLITGIVLSFFLLPTVNKKLRG